MFFIALVLLVALLMEGIGSFISVIGFGALFSMNPIIMTMAVILDAAKIVSVTFLYQCWRDLGWWWKTTFIPAAIFLVIITSAGVFGYLTGEFQRALQPNMQSVLQVESLKREKVSVDAERTQLLDEKAKIDKQIAQLPDESVAGRQRLIRSFAPDLNRIRGRMDVVTKRGDELTKEILQAESENVEKAVHVGPILYVAKVFEITVEEASKWIILMLVLVFDPLAIMLVLAGNFLIARRRERLAPAVEEKLAFKKVEPGACPIGLDHQPMICSAGVCDFCRDYRKKAKDEAEKPAGYDEEPFDTTGFADSSSSVDGVTRTEAIGKIEPIKGNFESTLSSAQTRFEEPLPPAPSSEEAEQLIEEIAPLVEGEPVIPPSELESLNVTLPSALVREGARTFSVRRHLYEAL